MCLLSKSYDTVSSQHWGLHKYGLYSTLGQWWINDDQQSTVFCSGEAKLIRRLKIGFLGPPWFTGNKDYCCIMLSNTRPTARSLSLGVPFIILHLLLYRRGFVFSHARNNQMTKRDNFKEGTAGTGNKKEALHCACTLRACKHIVVWHCALRIFWINGFLDLSVYTHSYNYT